MTRIGENASTTRSTMTSGGDTIPHQPGGAAGSSLPHPTQVSGPQALDLETAIMMLAIESSRDSRANADAQRVAGEKAQETAHARKIDKMRELADDTFGAALVDGAFQGLSAAVQVGSAAASYSSATSELDAKKTPCLLQADKFGRDAATAARTSKLLDASSKVMSATGTIWSGAERAAQERDRTDLAVVDQDIDRAKSMVDGASAQSKHAQDDIHDVMSSLREYLAAKSQAAQAAILKA
jgi:hypothetical protein